MTIDIEFFQNLSAKPLAWSVGIVTDQDMIATFGKGQKRCLDGSNAGLEHPGHGTTFEFPHCLFKLPLGGQSVGPVGDPFIFVATNFNHLLIVVKEDG